MNIDKFIKVEDRSINTDLHVSSKIISDQMLFDTFAETLHFPFIPKNWNAFRDWMMDLSWLGQRTVELYHSELPRLSPKSMRAYLNVLDDSIRQSEEFMCPVVRVVFLFDAYAEVKKIW